MDISSATQFDNVTIRAEMRCIYNRKYNCDTEMAQLKERVSRVKGTPAYQKAMKDKLITRPKAKGCGYVLDRIVDRIDNIEYNTCLCKIKHPYFYTLSVIENTGNLPFSGGILEQPAQIIELMQIFKDAKIKEENIKAKEKKDK